ncbi:hypothetical protein [Sorangium sp. So ce1389]|uniref:hypothetical protein n=1 Tax=Sorangium sp. So ce1389 TaxID=3133336 RepID=UPI003F5FA4AC
MRQAEPDQEVAPLDDRADRLAPFAVPRVERAERLDVLPAVDDRPHRCRVADRLLVVLLGRRPGTRCGVDELTQPGALFPGDHALRERLERGVVVLAGRLARRALLEGVEPVEQRLHGHDRGRAHLRGEVVEHELLLRRVAALQRGADEPEVRLVPGIQLGDRPGSADRRGSRLSKRQWAAPSGHRVIRVDRSSRLARPRPNTLPMKKTTHRAPGHAPVDPDGTVQ